MSELEPPPPRHQARLLLRFALGCILIAVVTAAATATAAIETIGTVADDLALGGRAIRSTQLTAAQAGAPQTILIIGDDHIGPTTTYWTGGSDNVHGVHLLHADTMMLVRMDPNAGQTSILSIPRDLLVSFTYRGHTYRDQKFNSAYSIGGADLVLKVAKQTLPGIAINHVVDVNFASFLGVVKAIGCVYVDVDHRYYNPTGDSYLAIDIQPGYQRLCGQNALSYVRFRHTDSDFVRVARQQDFIRQAKEQLGTFGLLGRFNQLAQAFGRAISTDIRGYGEVEQLIELAVFSTSRPIRQVPFQVSNTDAVINGIDYVTATQNDIEQSLHAFLDENPTTKLAVAVAAVNAHAGRRRTSAVARDANLGLVPVAAVVRSDAVQMATGVPFPVEMPTVETGPAVANDFHRYTIRDQQGNLHHGYRVDWQHDALGGYYGIEGMDWTSPPLFATPTQTATLGGRQYMLVNDGAHIHDIGWREGPGLYWVSNTLREGLTNAQMLAIAESARPLR
jgi:polyisoprenyl-teichoic acid--peptidoglycan teichoic acid transferase